MLSTLRLLSLTVSLWVVFASPCRAQDAGELLRTMGAVGPDAAGSESARAAWKKLVGMGPQVLPQVLIAMDTPDPVVRNWMRTAFDRIADRARADGVAIPVQPLRAFVDDPSRHGSARRLALDLIEAIEPGTKARFIGGRLDDPEFRFEAVTDRADAGEAALKAGDRDKAAALWGEAFAASRDIEQAKALAGRLKAVKAGADLLGHLGYFHEWFVVGPFDANGKKGFATEYAPERGVDLSAKYDGKTGPVSWKRAVTADPQPRTGMISLTKELGVAYDAVGYAYAAFEVPAETEVEFRGGADDNFSVWVNGKREFGYEEYRNGLRPDRYRFAVKLKPGVNTVLVKVCQAPPDPTYTDTNWEFLLRMVDRSGKGFGFKPAPAK